MALVKGIKLVCLTHRLVENLDTFQYHWYECYPYAVYKADGRSMRQYDPIN